MHLHVCYGYDADDVHDTEHAEGDSYFSKQGFASSRRQTEQQPRRRRYMDGPTFRERLDFHQAGEGKG